MCRMSYVKGKNWVVYRIHDAALLEFARKYFSGRLIDIGCGRKPYQKLLSSFVSEHVGVDMPDCLHGTDRADLAGTAYAIPVADESFDCALSTAVLEHLEDPNAAIQEAFRVLKPGGTLLISAPFIWHLHEAPRDFFRYSRYGLAHLLTQNGFSVIELKALAGFWVTFGVIFSYYLHNFNRGIVKRTHLIPLLCHVVQRVALGLDSLHRDERWAWMHMAVAKKI